MNLNPCTFKNSWTINKNKIPSCWGIRRFLYVAFVKVRYEHTSSAIVSYWIHRRGQFPNGHGSPASPPFRWTMSELSIWVNVFFHADQHSNWSCPVLTSVETEIYFQNMLGIIWHTHSFFVLYIPGRNRYVCGVLHIWNQPLQLNCASKVLTLFISDFCLKKHSTHM